MTITADDLITALEFANPEELIKISRLIKFAERIIEGVTVDGPMQRITVHSDKKKGEYLDSYSTYRREDVQSWRATRAISEGETVKVNLGTGEVG